MWTKNRPFRNPTSEELFTIHLNFNPKRLKKFKSQIYKNDSMEEVK